MNWSGGSSSPVMLEDETCYALDFQLTGEDSELCFLMKDLMMKVLVSLRRSEKEIKK